MEYRQQRHLSLPELASNLGKNLEVKDEENIQFEARLSSYKSVRLFNYGGFDCRDGRL